MTLTVATNVTDATATLTLDRPQQKNALNTALLAQLAEALANAAADPGVRAVVLTGGPDVFAAGSDVTEMAAMGPAEVMLDARVGYWRRVAAFPKPLVAAVNGYALGGGCELAMHADIIVAGDTAVFGLPEVGLGLMPGAGGTQRLIRSVGKSLAMKMILSGYMLPADEALRAGLVSDAVPATESVALAHETARKIATKGPIAVRAAKQAVLAAQAGLSDGLALERRSFDFLAGTEDRAEGVAAFMEKRKPVFKGN